MTHNLEYASEMPACVKKKKKKKEACITYQFISQVAVFRFERERALVTKSL